MGQVFPLAARGYQEVVGFDIEKHPDLLVTAAYGLQIDPVTKFLRAISMGVDPNDAPVPRPSASGANVAGNYDAGTPREFQGVPDVRGPIEAEVDCDLFPYFLGSAMRVHGDPSLSPKLYEKSGAGPYVHVMRVPANGPSSGPPAFSIQRQTGRKHTKFGGCFVESLEISGENEGPLKWKAEILGQNYLFDDAADPVTFTASPIFRLHEFNLYMNAAAGAASPLAAGDVRRNIRNFTLAINNPYRAETTGGVEDSSGSCSSGRGIRRPILDDFPTYSLRFSTDWDTDVWQALMRTLGTTGYVTIELVIVADTPADRSYRFRMPAAWVRGGFPTFGGGAGPIPEEVEFEAASYNNGGTNEIFEATITNGQSADYFTTVGY